MAEPLSFVASLIGVASLAGTIVTKGYHYLRAVKHCSNEVRSLIVETNILCGILDRLVVLLQDPQVVINSQNRKDEDSETHPEHKERKAESQGIKEETTAIRSDSAHYS